MHVSSCLWSGALTDDLDMDDAVRAQHHQNRSIHYRRILDDGAIYAQPFSEGGAAASGAVAFGTTAHRVEGGWQAGCLVDVGPAVVVVVVIVGIAQTVAVVVG